MKVLQISSYLFQEEQKWSGTKKSNFVMILFLNDLLLDWTNIN